MASSGCRGGRGRSGEPRASIVTGDASSRGAPSAVESALETAGDGDAAASHAACMRAAPCPSRPRPPCAVTNRSKSTIVHGGDEPSAVVASRPRRQSTTWYTPLSVCTCSRMGRSRRASTEPAATLRDAGERRFCAASPCPPVWSCPETPQSMALTRRSDRHRGSRVGLAVHRPSREGTRQRSTRRAACRRAGCARRACPSPGRGLPS